MVEDETLVAFFLEDLLHGFGCEIAGTAWRLPQALNTAETIDADVAVLDVNIAGERIYPVADLLARRGIPFVFATGYGRDGMPERFSAAPVLSKPIVPDDLERALRTALGGA